MTEQPSFGLYVSCNRENPVPVARFGTGIAGMRSNTFIGAERDVANPRKISYYPERVIGIRADEYNKFRREYNRAIRCGDLVKRTEEDFKVAQQKAEAAEAEAGKKRVEAKKAKLEKAKAEQPADGPPDPPTGSSDNNDNDEGEDSKAPKTSKKKSKTA